jgi:hypothetical protein
LPKLKLVNFEEDTLAHSHDLGKEGLRGTRTSDGTLPADPEIVGADKYHHLLFISSFYPNILLRLFPFFSSAQQMTITVTMWLRLFFLLAFVPNYVLSLAPTDEIMDCDLPQSGYL